MQSECQSFAIKDTGGKQLFLLGKRTLHEGAEEYSFPEFSGNATDYGKYFFLFWNYYLYRFLYCCGFFPSMTWPFPPDLRISRAASRFPDPTLL